MAAQIDHVIILLPYRDIQHPPEWLTKHFTISPGGRHADGKTENRLIVFADGTYLELIAFVDDDPKHRENHWWGALQPGIIDYALTSTVPFTPSTIDTLNARLAALPSSATSSAPFSYHPPRRGGRTTPAGVELLWDVTFPQGRRGVLPFWCHDVTPRERRVNVGDGEPTRHASGVTGVRAVEVLVDKEEVERVREAVEVVTGSEDGRVGTPVVRTGREVEVKVREAEERGDELRLVLQGGQDVPTIAQGVGGGVVRIRFENVE